jgi:hypothetical protein
MITTPTQSPSEYQWSSIKSVVLKCAPLVRSSVQALLVTCKLVKDLVLPHLYATPAIKTREQFEQFATQPPVSSYFHVAAITWSVRWSRFDVLAQFTKFAARVIKWLKGFRAEEEKRLGALYDAAEKDRYHHWYERGIRVILTSQLIPRGLECV